MMISRAKASFVRMAPRKMRYVLDLVRGKSVPQAYSILDRTHKKASGIVRKLIMTAADAASKQHQVAAEDLKVVRIFADQAGIMKRFRAMSLGRAGEIRKRLSHVVVELDRISAVRETPAAPKQEKKEKTSKVEASPKAAASKTRKLAGASK
jgi:large subunit ribosomal protein L22